jgi:hypothetical protein
MYTYQTASLAFGLGIIGIIVGCFGLANGAFNLFVYYKREDVRKELEKQTREILEEVRKADNEEGGVSLDGTIRYDAMRYTFITSFTERRNATRVLVAHFESSNSRHSDPTRDTVPALNIGSYTDQS